MSVRHQWWWMIAVALAGLAVYFATAEQVFPAASIDLKIPRAQIQSIAERWADSLGYREPAAVKSTIFSFDEDTKTFLEYELGLSRANTLMKDKIPCWFWVTRLCRPLKQEQVSVSLSPGGRLVAFDHIIENDRELPSLSHERARQLAREFIETKAAQPLKGYRIVEDGTVSQPHRTDHYFSWEDAENEYHGARMRLYTYVSGNQITGYNEYLHIPETWLRQFAELRSYNKALEEVASIFYVILNASIFFAFVWTFTAGLLRWKLALAVSLLVGGMDLAESLNSLPSSLHNYTTTMSLNGYMVDLYVQAATSALGQVIQCFTLVGAAEALYRLAYPAKVALEKVFSTGGLRSAPVLTGLIAGHGLFGVHLAWVVLYYLYGRDLGLWSPLEVRNVESLSAYVPAFSAMYVGVTAAIFEELTYRVLGMSLLEKAVRHFWLANLLQAAAWAFMHSNYPQEPPWARGVELTAVGLIYGLVLRRWGLIPCLVSHYVFDAFLGVAPLLSSPLPALEISAVVAVAPFLALVLAALYFSSRKGRLADSTEIANSSIPRPARTGGREEPDRDHQYRYEPLSGRVRRTLAALAIVSALIELGFYFPVIGQEARLTVSRDSAVSIARSYLTERGLPPLGRFEVAWLTRGFDAQALQYAYEKEGFRRTAALAMEPGHPLVWQVRFFRPLDPEEYLVTLTSRGQPVSVGIVKAEDAPGARLTPDQAQEQAQDYLRAEHPDMKPAVLEDVSENRRKHRTDWTVQFEVPKFRVAEADFTVRVGLVGALIGSYDQFWELPDKWLWERSRQTTKDQICGYLVRLLWLVMVVAGIWWVVGVARAGAIRWRPAVILAAVAALLVVPQALNDLPEFFVGYGTDTPLLSYFIAQGVRQVLTAVTSVAMTAGLAAFALASLRILFPRLSLTAVLRAGLTREPQADRDRRWDFWLDAALIGYAMGIGMRALGVLISYIHAWISPVVTLAPLDSFCALSNVYSPALDSIMDGVSRGLSGVLVTGVIVGLYAKYFKGFRSFFAFALIVSLVYPSTNRYWQDYMLDAVSSLAYFTAAWLIIARLARLNILAYFLTAAIGIMTAHLRVLMSLGPDFYARDIAILALVLASPLIYLTLMRFQSFPRGAPKHPAPAASAGPEE